MQRSIYEPNKTFLCASKLSAQSLKLAIRDFHVKALLSQLGTLVRGEKLKDNIQVLNVLLSPYALQGALLAGLLLRAKLF